VRAKVCTFLVEPQMMGVFTFQGMGMGFRALALTMSRGVIFVIPGLILLSDIFGVYGAFAAQPVSDVLGLLTASTMLLRAYRQYPVTASLT
jgi:Na+-driven multidrug efflux pump